MSSMVMQSGYYFSSKCKTENMSNEESVPWAEFFWGDLERKPSKTSTKNQSQKKKGQQKYDSKKKRKSFVFRSLESKGVGCWADKFLNEQLEPAGEKE